MIWKDILENKYKTHKIQKLLLELHQQILKVLQILKMNKSIMIYNLNKIILLNYKINQYNQNKQQQIVEKEVLHYNNNNKELLKYINKLYKKIGFKNRRSIILKK